MKVIIIFIVLIGITACSEKSSDFQSQYVWIFNDSIQFNSAITHLLIDKSTNSLYCNGLTYIEHNSSIVKINSKGWSQVGTSIGMPFYGMELYQNKLYIAGSGLNLNGIGYQRLLCLNNGQWEEAIEPNGAWGRSLTTFNNELYFGSSAFHKFDGNTWTLLSSDYKDLPYKLYSNEELLLGVLGQSLFHLDKWDFEKNSWETISPETPNLINSILISEENIYIGSRFSPNNNEFLINGIAKFDGEKWQDITYNIFLDTPWFITLGEINDLYNFKDEIYASITMFYKETENYSVPESQVHFVMKLVGDNWEQIGDRFNGKVFTFIEYNGSLYIGGDFTGCLAKLKER